MSEIEWFECDRCGFVGNKIHPIYDLPIGREYDGEMLCASCRLSQRMQDGDFDE